MATKPAERLHSATRPRAFPGVVGRVGLEPEHAAREAAEHPESGVARLTLGAYICEMPYDESIFNELNWLEIAGYIGLFVLTVWLLMDGPFHRLGEGHQWLVIALLSVGFPVLVYFLRGSDGPSLLTKCASLLGRLRP